MDLAIVETGNGGDIQLLGNDLQMVFNGENNIYLGLFGGNKEQVTRNRVSEAQSFDFWANNLFFPSNQSAQFNSTTEKTFQNTALTSSGRVLIENAMKEDLKFMTDFGKVEVSATITATDRIEVIIKWITPEGGPAVTIINYRKTTDGDFFVLDFNNDFNL